MKKTNKMTLIASATVAVAFTHLAHAQDKQVEMKFPDGHPKLPHFWPGKLLQAGRPDYDDSVLMAMRAAASLSR